MYTTYKEMHELVNNYFDDHREPLTKLLLNELKEKNINVLIYKDMLESGEVNNDGALYLCPKNSQQREQWDLEQGHDWGKVLIQPNFCKCSIKMLTIQANQMMNDLKLNDDYYLETLIKN